eukprot:5193097-Amphidinium_carterae.1
MGVSGSVPGESHRVKLAAAKQTSATISVVSEREASQRGRGEIDNICTGQSSASAPAEEEPKQAVEEETKTGLKPTSAKPKAELQRSK